MTMVVSVNRTLTRISLPRLKTRPGNCHGYPRKQAPGFRGSAGQDNRNLDLAPCSHHLQRHVIAMPPDPKIRAGGAQLQITKDNLVEKGRQAWIAQTNFAVTRVEFETKCGLKQGEWRRARPGLRRACYRIERRAAPILSPKAAEQLGKPPQVHVGCRVKQRLEQLFNAMLEPISREPQRNERIIVGPDRSVMIGHRIVTRLSLRHRANAPAGEEVRPHQTRGDEAGAVLPDEAGEQQLSGIRRANAARLLVSVEGDGVGRQFIAPENFLEPLRETVSLRLKLPRPIRQSHALRA